eukprot:364636-Chlamydomonas_euryale.AAC.2
MHSNWLPPPRCTQRTHDVRPHCPHTARTWSSHPAHAPSPHPVHTPCVHPAHEPPTHRPHTLPTPRCALRSRTAARRSTNHPRPALRTPRFSPPTSGCPCMVPTPACPHLAPPSGVIKRSRFPHPRTRVTGTPGREVDRHCPAAPTAPKPLQMCARG